MCMFIYIALCIPQVVALLCVWINVVLHNSIVSLFFPLLSTKAFVCFEQMAQDFKKSLLVCLNVVPCNT